MNLKDLIIAESANVEKYMQLNYIDNGQKLRFDIICDMISDNKVYGISRSQIFNHFRNAFKDKTYQNNIKETATTYYKCEIVFAKMFYEAMEWCEGIKTINVKSINIEKLLIYLATCCHYVINKKEYSNIAVKNAKECLDVLKNKFKINFPKLENDLKSF